MGVFDRIFQQARRNEARRVRHIDHQDGADLVGNLPHPGIVPFAGIGGSAADDHLWLHFKGDALHLSIVDTTGLRIETIRDRLVQDAGGIDRRAMREMPAVGKIQAHKGVARVKDSHLDGQVGLGAGMGLHVGIFGVIELLDAVDGELLDLVDHLAAAVIAPAGIPLRILVGADGAHCFHYLIRNVIL